MAFIDELKKGAKNLADKASDTVEKTKYQIKIGEENKKIDEFKKQLGEIVLAKFLAGELVVEEAKPICDQIKECLDKIGELEKQIEEIKE